jgi:hypothetical protein
MAVLGAITKQPNEILDFDIDYTTVLTGRTDSLATATSAVTPAGGVTTTSTTVSGNKVKVVISSGTTGVSYKVTVTTNTSAGLRYEDEVNVVVEET